MAAVTPLAVFARFAPPYRMELPRRITALPSATRARRAGRPQRGFRGSGRKPAARTLGRQFLETARTVAAPAFGRLQPRASGAVHVPGQARFSAARNVRVAAASAATAGGLCLGLLYLCSRDADDSPFPPMHPHEFRPFALTSKTRLSPTVSLFRFTYPPEREMTPDTLARLPVCSVVLVKDDTCQVARPYTPLQVDEKGFTVAVKRYKDGQASRFLHDVCGVGRMVEFRGPLRSAPFGEETGEEERVYGMIAGGTGITPMYKLIKHYFGCPGNAHGKRVKVSLVYAASSPAELFFREELDELAAAYPDQLKLTYLVDSVPPSEGATPEALGVRVGRLTDDVVRDCMPPAAEQGPAPVILVCGPDPMLRLVAGDRPLHTDIDSMPDSLDSTPAGGLLGRAGYRENQVFKF